MKGAWKCWIKCRGVFIQHGVDVTFTNASEIEDALTTNRSRDGAGDNCMDAIDEDINVRHAMDGLTSWVAKVAAFLRRNDFFCHNFKFEVRADAGHPGEDPARTVHIVSLERYGDMGCFLNGPKMLAVCPNKRVMTRSFEYHCRAKSQSQGAK